MKCKLTVKELFEKLVAAQDISQDPFSPPLLAEQKRQEAKRIRERIARLERKIVLDILSSV